MYNTRNDYELMSLLEPQQQETPRFKEQELPRPMADGGTTALDVEVEEQIAEDYKGG